MGDVDRHKLELNLPGMNVREADVPSKSNVAILSMLPALFWAFASPAQASWLSDVTGINIDVPAGHISVDTPHPEHIPQMILQLTDGAKRYFLGPVGPPMAFEVRQAKEQAEGSAQPIPSDIRQRLAPYFPPRILDIARFTTSSRFGVSIVTGKFELANIATAMTVDNVIVFSDDTQAQSVSLWARELVHVTQYQNLGIDGFAAVYMAPGYKFLEHDANAWQAHVDSELQASMSSAGSVAPQWNDTAIAPRQLSWNDFRQAALQVVPPTQCALMQQVGIGAVAVQNICPIGIVITMVQVGAYIVPCVTPLCYYPPNSWHVITGPPGPVTSFRFAFRP